MSSADIALLCWSDYIGITRCRGVPRADLPKRMANGLGWAAAGSAMTPFADLASNPWGPLVEIRQVPVASTETHLDLWPGVPPFHVLLCEGRTSDGQPWDCCTRSFMTRALADFEAETGLRFTAAFEHEFLLTGPDLPVAPPFSIEAMRSAAPFLAMLSRALHDAGLEPQTIEPEYGVSQFEIATAPAVGPMAGDRALLTREIIREVARRSGLKVSFTPKPAPDAVGIGAHVHFSFVDAVGRNAAYDRDGEGEASRVAQQFLAGLVRYLPSLCAIFAPSPVSYFRLGPHHWSCGYASFGIQNREAAVRICPSPETDPTRREGAFNMELRAPDATANPHLVVGAIVRAGLEGIRQALPMPQATQRDPADLSDAERQALGIVALPTSLAEALDRLEQDSVASGFMPPTMLATYVAVKRREIALMAGKSDAEICALYGAVY